MYDPVTLLNQYLPVIIINSLLFVYYESVSIEIVLTAIRFDTKKFLFLVLTLVVNIRGTVFANSEQLSLAISVTNQYSRSSIFKYSYICVLAKDILVKIHIPSSRMDTTMPLPVTPCSHTGRTLWSYPLNILSLLCCKRKAIIQCEKKQMLYISPPFVRELCNIIYVVPLP